MRKRARNVSSLALALVMLGTCFAFAACSEASVPASEDGSSVLNHGTSVPGADAEPPQESTQPSGISLPVGSFENLFAAESETYYRKGITIFDEAGWRLVPSPFDNALGDFFGVADKEGFVAITPEGKYRAMRRPA